MLRTATKTFIPTRLKSTSTPTRGARTDPVHNDRPGGPVSVPFARAKTGPFVQAQPKHENAFTSDVFMMQTLRRLMPAEVFNAVQPDLERFGHRVSSDIWRLGQECAVNEPYLRQTTAWGQRIDEVVTCDAWKQQKRISAEEGLIAAGYERQYGEFSRLYQVAKLYLYSPASGLYSCPLAMTDGAAKILEAQNLTETHSKYFAHLTSRDPDQFWTSGQWMTEKRGGSDVANGTETIAIPHESGEANLFRLQGYKWFSSATDSDMTITLARIPRPDGSLPEGTRGISMFLLPTRNPDGALNNIEVVKLKNKLGTRQLPTGELLIDGAVAQLISEEGRGIASISNMLTLTRIHNCISSVSGPRKLLSLARDYAVRRKAFGMNIHQSPLHLQTLGRMEAEIRGCSALVFDLALKLGQQDCKTISEQDSLLLRLMTPVAKMYTAKRAMELTSEGLECFGGQGYIEDTGLPAFLRDTQVLPIWEGTSNVMSLDVMRAIAKTNGQVLVAVQNKVKDTVNRCTKVQKLKTSCDVVDKALSGIMDFAINDSGKLECAARDFTFSLAHVYIGALLLDHAAASGCQRHDLWTVQQWVQRDLAPVVRRNKMGDYDVDNQLRHEYAYDGYDENNLIEPTHVR